MQAKIAETCRCVKIGLMKDQYQGGCYGFQVYTCRY